jgi:hypothetical protein
MQGHDWASARTNNIATDYFSGSHAIRARLAVSKLMALAYACSITGMTVRGSIQPSRALHGGAVIRVGDTTDQAHLVGLVRLPVKTAVRPGETVAAAHFDKTLQYGGCHTCHVIFL